MKKLSKNSNSIAIIGMSGKFPGSNSIEEFWQNLCKGKETISFFSENELYMVGVSEEMLQSPNYVKAKGIIKEIDFFDADFFGFSSKEAEGLDPQQRLFLENAWEALEDAGYVTEEKAGKIGVYASSGLNNYYSFYLANNSSFMSLIDSFQLSINNMPDTLCTRVSYKLNFTGPSYAIQSGCSSSLVAVATACQSLLNYECDLALSGGVSLSLPLKTGYFYQEGMILSSDGHCRPFDSQADGTVPSMGLGIVVLKRLEEALEARDSIYAVIKGFAVNNDGSKKIGYTAPSVIGQTNVISEAQGMADIDLETISYIETHGTGTQLGDPIEIKALTEAFKEKTNKKQFCVVGSLKSNMGHLDAAAGVAGLIKTALALQNHLLPPTLHFLKPNSKIDFENSPFYVNTQLMPWNNKYPRRAGISSFGIGGTNVHVILEEAPFIDRELKDKDWHLFVLSTKTLDALEIATNNLFHHLMQKPQLNLSNTAYTLAVGRKSFDYRRIIIVKNKNQLHRREEVFIKDFSIEKLMNIKTIESGLNETLNLHLQNLLNENYNSIYKALINKAKSYFINVDSHFFSKRNEPCVKIKFLRLLAELWGKGIEIDWKCIYSHQTLQRVSLPTYPFQRKKYWAKADILNLTSTGNSNNKNLHSSTFVINSIEQTLIEIWQSYFGVKKINPTDDFFALGGDSLLAVDLICKINKQFKSNLSPNILLTASTIASLAEKICVNQSTFLPFSILSLNQGQPLRTPLFLIHPAGGTTYIYRELTFSLPDYQPIYAIQSKTLDGKTPLINTIEEMAKEYLQDVTAVQSQGPYQLAGASFGGLVAFEMARLLSDSGKEVKFLGLMDSPHPGFVVSRKYFANVIKNMLEFENKQKIDLAYLCNFSKKELINYFIQHCNSKLQGLKIQSELFLKILDINVKAIRHYLPKPYLGRVVFFKALETSPYMPENLLYNWKPFTTKDMDVIHVNGNHFTMFSNPNVNELGKHLQFYISRETNSHKVNLPIALLHHSENSSNKIDLFTEARKQTISTQKININENFLKMIVPSYNLDDIAKKYNQHSPQALEEYSRYAASKITIPEKSINKYARLITAIKNINVNSFVDKVELIQKYPEIECYIKLLDHCIKFYPKILSGKINHMNVLFPQGKLDLVKSIYQNNPISDYFNDIIAKTVLNYLNLIQPKKANILEIGAGTGSTTKFVLPHTKDKDLVYYFTDRSLVFLKEAKNRFCDYKNIVYQIHNIEDSQSDEFKNKFDIVIANNVLHATRNIENTLKNVKSLIKENGIFVLGEGTSKSDFSTIVFGLTPGWWLYEDVDCRIPDTPILTLENWVKLLKKTGFKIIKSHFDTQYQISQTEVIAVI